MLKTWVSCCAVLGIFLGGCVVQRSLPEVSPPDAGVAPAAVLAFVDQAEQTLMGSGEAQKGSVHAFMLIRNDEIFAKGAWAPYSLETPRELFSVSKSFTAMAIGFALQEKRLTLDDKVVSFFPEETPADASEYLRNMTVRDLLTMRSGHEECVIGAMFGGDGTMIANFLAQPVPRQPGTHFVYNNGATYMLSALLTKVTGEPLVEYLQPRLFDPLQIAPPYWSADESTGVNFGAWGLRLTAEELGKFGIFCLHHGNWQGEQLLDPAFVQTAVTPQLAVDATTGYGFQFWTTPDHYRAAGYLGQLVLVYEKENTVLVLLAGTAKEPLIFDAINAHLLPALRADATSSDQGTDELQQRLAGLHIAVPPATTEKPCYTSGDSITIQFDDNPQDLACATLDFTETGCVFREPARQMEFHYGKWTTIRQAEDYGLQDEAWYTQAVWTSPTELELISLRAAGPWQTRLQLRFDGEEVIAIGTLYPNQAPETFKGTIQSPLTPSEYDAKNLF